MSPDDRRQAILDAVVPLVVETGRAPTTREIADAAGVAEGTIFRVFDDLRALMWAIAKEVLNPARGRAEFRQALDGLDTLHDKVQLTTETLLTQTHRGIQVMVALRSHLMIQPGEGQKPATPPQPPAFMREANVELLELLEQMFAEHRDELRVAPIIAATSLRSLVLGARHPGMDAAPDLTADQITDILLGGVTRDDTTETS